VKPEYQALYEFSKGWSQDQQQNLLKLLDDFTKELKRRDAQLLFARLAAIGLGLYILVNAL
jgi:hypothetical protein